MDIREKMRRDWDRRARVDPRYWVAATQEADEASYVDSAERDTAALLAGLGDRVPPTGRVLDLGCGIGRMAAPLAAHFARVVGVDVSPAMIEQAQALHGALANLRFEANSGADLGAFADDSFELVFSYSVLPHLPPEVVEAYFREVNRVLVDDGWLRYQFWIGPERRMADNDTLNIRVYDPERFQALNREAGFTVVDIEEIDYFDPVLELKPVWVTARRTGTPTDGAAADFSGRPATVSEEERSLEYGLLLYLAVKHGERGERAEAERVLEEATACDPTRPEAWITWAMHRLEQDDMRGARLMLESLTEKVPTLGSGWLYRAQVAAADEDFADARAALAQAEALDIDDAELLGQAAELRALLADAPAAPGSASETGAESKAGRRRKTRKKVVKRRRK